MEFGVAVIVCVRAFRVRLTLLSLLIEFGEYALYVVGKFFRSRYDFIVIVRIQSLFRFFYRVFNGRFILFGKFVAVT